MSLTYFTTFWHQADWHTNLLWCQGTQPDHLQVESSSCCFPSELVSFDPWHMTCSSLIGKLIWVGRYNKIICLPLREEKLQPHIVSVEKLYKDSNGEQVRYELKKLLLHVVLT